LLGNFPDTFEVIGDASNGDEAMAMIPDQVIGLLKQLSAQMDRKPVTSLTIRRGNKMLLVKLEDVVYMEARDKYVSLFTEKGAEFLTTGRNYQSQIKKWLEI